MEREDVGEKVYLWDILNSETSKYATTWADIKLRLPENFDKKFSHQKRFVRDYFRAQLRIAECKPVKAKKLLYSLGSKEEFVNFESMNEPLFAAIDIAVTGKTNRVDELGDPVFPSFENIKKPKV